MDRILKLLRKNAVFAATGEDLLRRLASRSSAIHYDVGDLVLHDGEPAQRVFALLSGTVKVYHVSPTGEEVTVKLFRAPALFGEAEALARLPYQEHVKALEPCEIAIIPVESFVLFLREDHEAAYRMLLDVAKRLSIASYNEKSLAFHPSTVRLANYLLDYAAWKNPPATPEWRIDLTQEQMAEAIGVTRRSVAKDMAAWKAEGILERGADGVYVLRDPEALRRYGDPDRLNICYSVDEPSRP